MKRGGVDIREDECIGEGGIRKIRGLQLFYTIRLKDRYGLKLISASGSPKGFWYRYKIHLLLPPSPSPQPAPGNPFPSGHHTIGCRHCRPLLLPLCLLVPAPSPPTTINLCWETTPLTLTWGSSRLLGKPLDAGEWDKRWRLYLLLKLICSCISTFRCSDTSSSGNIFFLPHNRSSSSSSSWHRWRWQQAPVRVVHGRKLRSRVDAGMVGGNVWSDEDCLIATVFFPYFLFFTMGNNDNFLFLFWWKNTCGNYYSRQSLSTFLFLSVSWFFMCLGVKVFSRSCHLFQQQDC